MPAPFALESFWDDLQVRYPKRPTNNSRLGSIQEATTFQDFPVLVVRNIIWLKRRRLGAWKFGVNQKWAVIDVDLFAISR